MIQETVAKSILRKHKKIDSWFLSSYSISLYRGCAHNCVYCDGRSEKYQVGGEFGSDNVVKINAIDILRKELNPARKRSPVKGGFFMIGNGVSDAYQPYEKRDEFCRQALELLYDNSHPVHILTKSTLIERDIDLLKKINERNKALVSFSFSSVDDTISKLLEPGVPAPSYRLNAITKMKEAGIRCGMYLMPVVPFITDSYEMIENAVVQAKNAGVDFIIFGGMTLKDGRQKDYFMDFLKKHFPEHVTKYKQMYSVDPVYGMPDMKSANPIDRIFNEVSTRHGIPKRIPAKIFEPLVGLKELVLLILEQLDYLAKLKGNNSPYGYAAFSLSKITVPVEELTYDDLVKISGIGPFTAKIIQEIVKTRRCAYYEKML